MLSYAWSVFLYTALIKIADAVTALAVWYACWQIRFHWLSVPKGLPAFGPYNQISVILVLVISAVLHSVGAYRSDRIQFGFRAIKKTVQGAWLGTLVFIAMCYFLGQIDFSRVYLLLYAALLACGLVLERALLHTLWRRWLSRGVRRLRVLLVGGGDLLDMYVSKLQQRQPYPVEWVGHLKMGEETRLSSYLAQTTPDQVVVAYPEQTTAYSAILERLSEELVDVKVLPDFGRYSTFTYVAKEELGIPLLAFNQTPAGNSARALKRCFDCLGALAFLVVCSPLYAVIALLVKATSRGPVFFAQERVGADGRQFTLYKFRTMDVNAEKETGPVWAVPDDPRTTPLGRWLRRTSLDEIPQFWNVLKGEMSLVGPRPERPEFVAQFKKEIPKYMLRHKMKSGITGWAQVNGWRGNTSLHERIKYDLFYIGHWSHFFDFKILCLTLIRGFVHRHAY